MAPSVTLILPIHNEAVFIERCLSAVMAQDYPADRLQVIVVDGMSTDQTRNVVEAFAARYNNLDIRIFDNPGKIVPTGMNIALARAVGEIIIRVDGHCIIAPDYVSRCVEHLLKDDVDGVGGPMDSIGETPMARAIAIGMSSQFGVGNSAFRTTSGRSMLADSVPFPAYTRQMFERAGLYDEELVRNQDDEYNYRIRELGGKLLLADDVRSTYFSRTSLARLWRQYYQYGFWKVRVLQKHPRQMSLRQFVPPAFVLSLFLSLLISFSPMLRPLALVVPVFYLLGNLTASVVTASRRGWNCLPYLPIIYAILHLSYGLGFLVGLIQFRNRWNDKTGKTPVWSGETLG